jgi:hypothetical protein
MSERRYNDEETAAIFRAAADDRRLPQGQTSGNDGLTLAQLQAIGGEVGISSDAVASAATAIDIHREATERTFLGLPIAVSRTVDLNRQMTDREWELLVVRLREVFNARGTTRSEGSFRQWTNGNLHVLLEPTEHGQRLRFGTFNRAARMSITSGLMALGMAGVVAVTSAMGGTLVHATPSLGMFGLIGFGMIANGALRLPGWARLRGRQMEALAAGVARPSTALPPASSKS